MDMISSSGKETRGLGVEFGGFSFGSRKKSAFRFFVPLLLIVFPHINSMSLPHSLHSSGKLENYLSVAGP